MSKTKLRPCPFCWSVDVAVADTGYVLCMDCNAEGPVAKSKYAAIRAWNDRPGNTINEQIGCLADIRRVVGDPTGKLMQDELVERITSLVADAALGRAVRKIPDMAKLWHADDSQTWYLHPGDAPCLPLGTGSTPEAALKAAGLMKEEK